MPASFFCVSGCRGWESGCRDAGRNLGISGCRAVFGISGGGRACRSGDAGERLAGKGGGAFGGLPGARKTAGHSEDCRTLGGRERGLWELVRVSGAACKRMGGELSGIAGGAGLLAANCRGRRGGVSGAGALGRGPLESEGVGCLEAICLAGISLDAGKGLRMRRVAGCSGVGLKPGGGVPAFVWS